MHTHARFGVSAITSGLLALSAALWTTSGLAQGAADTAAETAKPVTEQARTFIEEAAGGNLGEVVVGARAEHRADSAEVRQYGLMMVDDHHKANRELIPIAEANDVDWPTQLPEKMKQLIDELKQLSGAEFDRKYMNAMLEEHRKDIDKYQQMQGKVEDEALSQYIETTLPILKEHLDRAEQITQTMEQTQPGQ